MSSHADADVKKGRSSCSPPGKSQRLGFMMLLTLGFFLVELIVGERSVKLTRVS